MEISNHLIIVFLFCMTCCFASPTPALLPPSRDAFYDRPQGYQSAALGTILRHRLAPAPFAKYKGQPKNVKATYQFLFRTTDSVGRPDVAVTTIVVPENANGSQLLSFQPAYDSAYNDCSPSYQFLTGATANTTGSIDELGAIAPLLAKGIILNIPDYEGLQATYSAGIGEGQAVLDSIRAALSSGKYTGVSPNATLAMWGYSGGSFASQWASELQPTYAPELIFAGTAAGGLTPNLTSVFLTINDTPAAGLAIAAILGLSKAYSNLSDYLDTHLITSKAATFRMGNHRCFEADGEEYANQNLSDYFRNGQKFLSAPVPASIVNIAGILGRHGPPQQPLYLYKAVYDEISNITDSDKLMEQYCAQGVSVQYVRSHKGTHEEEFVLGAPGAIKFVEFVMGGGKVSPGCTTMNVNT